MLLLHLLVKYPFLCPSVVLTEKPQSLRTDRLERKCHICMQLLLQCIADGYSDDNDDDDGGGGGGNNYDDFASR